MRVALLALIAVLSLSACAPGGVQPSGSLATRDGSLSDAGAAGARRDALADATPADQTRGDATTDDATPFDPTRADATRGDATPGDATTDDATPFDPTRADATPADATPVDPSADAAPQPDPDAGAAADAASTPAPDAASPSSDAGPSPQLPDPTRPNFAVVAGNAVTITLPSSAYALISGIRAGAEIGSPAGANLSGAVLTWVPSDADTGITKLHFRDGAGATFEPWIWVARTAHVCTPGLVTGAGDLDSSRVISRAACERLNALYASGVSAGNAGDLYDNRDGTHVHICEDWNPASAQGCPIPNRLFPQHEWRFSSGFAGCAAPPSEAAPYVTFGQESCAGTGDRLHGIAYTYYLGQGAADTAYALYTASNLYAFPTLSDDDFPGGQTTDPTILADPRNFDRSKATIANSPYVLGTKEICTHVYGGSTYAIHNASGSDLPFVKLMLAASAALRPEVKRALMTGVEIGGVRVSFIGPVIQWLLRSAHRDVRFDPARFLGGVVHRSSVIAHYFAGGLPQPAYDAALLVERASAMTVADVPPLVQLRVVSETFDPAERMFTTPGAVARRLSVGGPSRTIRVSAAGSVGLAGERGPFEIAWRVLDSDETRVRISVDPADPAEAEIELAPTASVDRIDVGVFVRRSGASAYSVPGIISAHVGQ